MGATVVEVVGAAVDGGDVAVDGLVERVVEATVVGAAVVVAGLVVDGAVVVAGVVVVVVATVVLSEFGRLTRFAATPPGWSATVVLLASAPVTSFPLRARAWTGAAPTARAINASNVAMSGAA